MIVLSCESSTLLGSVAIFNDSKLLAYKESLRQGSHADRLNLFIDEVLKEANLQLSDIDLFVTGIGPGSFTGIRISLNTIKTFAYCYNKPVFAINSLENLAWQCPEKSKSIVTMLNAYKNMVYIATYKKENDRLITLKEPEVVRVQNLNDYITENVTVVGDGFTTYSKYFDSKLMTLISRDLAPEDDPKAFAAQYFVFQLTLKPIHWASLLPLYLRASEAEENLKGIKFQALS
ncbi:MAG: tRNA (adenosine(37)-N6)-threonylcarbamoyltransferase complex dimerization subunit type 1 TsaB [Bdellovibrio sp.]|nr:tRNA (adenosine(37)-N6)-threonylcarbamoyltransferase complex dimerization subunit type 1 TsaB [Bdellovibrio sp.]